MLLKSLSQVAELERKKRNSKSPEIRSNSKPEKLAII